MYLSGHFDLNPTTGYTLSGQKWSNVGCMMLTGSFTLAFLSDQLIYVDLKKSL